MKNYFARIRTVEELEKRYRELQFQHHPDRNNNSPESITITQQINAEFVRRKYAMENPTKKAPKTTQKHQEARNSSEAIQSMPENRFFGEKEVESMAETGAKFGSAILRGVLRGFAKKYNHG